jgi:predicted nucleic acid-binding protein
MSILADTSMWVDHLRDTDTALGRVLITGSSVAYTEPVLMEVLMGARNHSEWRTLRRFLTGAELIPFESIADFEGAARINRRGRANGITLSKFDCLILAVAKRTRAALMTRDQRQADLARLIGVEHVA